MDRCRLGCDAVHSVRCERTVQRVNDRKNFQTAQPIGVDLNPVYGCWNCIQAQFIAIVSEIRDITNIQQIMFELHIRNGHLILFP
jgi:hypothetical protein